MIRSYFDCRELYCSLSFGEGWGEGNYSAAQSFNNSINTTLLPEINQKNYNNIIIQRYTRMLSMPH